MTPSARTPPALSVEFFPPKTPQGAERLRAVRRELYALNPEFCSVTFGAGGSTQEGTLNTVQEILDEGHVGVAHFSCVGATQVSARAHLSRLADMGVRRIVALRGDLPSGFGSSGEFTYAKDLVAFVVREFPGVFHIEVAAYPETHPQARSYQADLQAFVQKVQAGAHSAITQYFFSAQAYYRFVDDVSAHSVSIPIVPGLMPITNSSQLLRFSDACGAEVPRWIRQRLETFGDDSASIKAFGLEVMTRLCEELQAQGVPGIHFYSLNHSEAILGICQNLGWSPQTV
jgi:methylenetetrahydrofolate reductase (NADPH)